MSKTFSCPLCIRTIRAERCYEIEPGVAICEECIGDCVDALRKVFRDEYDFGVLGEWIIKKIGETEELVENIGGNT